MNTRKARYVSHIYSNVLRGKLVLNWKKTLQRRYELIIHRMQIKPDRIRQNNDDVLNFEDSANLFAITHEVI